MKIIWKLDILHYHIVFTSLLSYLLVYFISKSIRTTHIFGQIYLGFENVPFPNKKAKEILCFSQSSRILGSHSLPFQQNLTLLVLSGGRESYSSKHIWDVLWNFLPSFTKWSPTDSRQSLRMKSQLESYSSIRVPSVSSTTLSSYLASVYLSRNVKWNVFHTDRALPTHKMLALSEICLW